ncbi:MAG: DUF5026 domain-containing protein [Bacteroides sp.]
MSLIKDNTEKIFDPKYVRKGDLISTKRTGWNKAKNGIITSISDDKLTVLTLPDIGNVTNYFVIDSAEVYRKEWEIRWTNDLITIHTEGVI